MIIRLQTETFESRAFGGDTVDKFLGYRGFRRKYALEIVGILRHRSAAVARFYENFNGVLKRVRLEHSGKTVP